MRIAVLGDIHANDDALRAVLHDARAQGINRFECLGDVVGYHALARETLDLAVEQGLTSVAGNHDRMAVGGLDAQRCGPRARAAIELTRARLDDAHVRWLAALPLSREDGPLLFVHSTLTDPEARLVTPLDFQAAAADVRRLHPAVRVCFTAHTHRQEVHDVSPSGQVHTVALGVRWRMRRDGWLRFVNPGSVGYARDGDPRAAYALFDVITESVQFRRVSYDARRVLDADERCGLLTPAATSLHFGARALAMARAIASSMT